jgi:hypothetical protein
MKGPSRTRFRVTDKRLHRERPELRIRGSRPSLAVVDDMGLTTAAGTLTERVYWRKIHAGPRKESLPMRPGASFILRASMGPAGTHALHPDDSNPGLSPLTCHGQSRACAGFVSAPSV